MLQRQSKSGAASDNRAWKRWLERKPFSLQGRWRRYSTRKCCSGMAGGRPATVSAWVLRPGSVKDPSARAFREAAMLSILVLTVAVSLGQTEAAPPAPA